METAQDVASDALKLILVEADEAPLQATEYADFYTVMNDFMAQLEAENIVLGYTRIAAGTDLVTVPDGALMGIKSNCAIMASPQYGGSVSAELREQANSGMKVLETLGMNMPSTAMPGNLPQGGGTGYSQRDWAYFDNQAGALLALSGNAVATTIAATDTPVRVDGFWKVIETKGLKGDINGVIRNISDETLVLDINIELSATGNSTYTFKLLRNATHLETSVAAALTATPATVILKDTVTLDPGEYLSIWGEDDLATENFTVIDAQFEVS